MRETGWPGGKASPGVWQAIVNQQPPHRVYVEAFAGGAAVLRAKRPAAVNIALDLDRRALARLADRPDVTAIEADAVAWLAAHDWQGDELVYADPPYPGNVRRLDRAIYAHEMLDEAAHERLLDVLVTLPCAVQVSGYASPLYARRLAGWRLVTFTGQTRGGPSVEHLWCNYPAPPVLHDWRFVGDGYRERERIKKQVRRWAAKLGAAPGPERQAILSALVAQFGSADPAAGGDAGSRDDALDPLAAGGDGAGDTATGGGARARPRLVASR
ncbi:MAG: DNA adenine methylase [Vicinamibacterales bacterium]